MNFTAIKDKVTAESKGVATAAKQMSLGDWGSLASLIAIGLWLYDHSKKPKRA